MPSGKVEGMATPIPKSSQFEATSSATPALSEAIAIMARLRAPDGCPWDREQTFDTIKRHTLEETYEVFDAIERRAWPDLKDELGDLLLQVLFYAQMASEAGYFNIEDVAANLNAKLIRRHPHIFGDVVGDGLRRRPPQLGADQAIRKEGLFQRTNPRCSTTFPAPCRRCWKQRSSAPAPRRSVSTGPNADGLFDKLQEEIGELKAELLPSSATQSAPRRSRQSLAISSSPRSISPAISKSIPNPPCARQRKVPPPLRRDGVRGGQHRRSGGLHAIGAGLTMESGEKRLQRAAKVMNEGPQTEIRIQPLTSLEHFERCVVLQLEVWGYSDGDVIPRRVFVVAQRIGGQVVGAFDGETLIGFAMSLPGYRDGKPYLHSHMLAVMPEYRNFGLGRRLKLAQRDDAIARGFDLMEWTFDPLEIRNAHLNIARLGVIVRRYQPDFYGPSSSPLQGACRRIGYTLSGGCAPAASPVSCAEKPRPSK